MWFPDGSWEPSTALPYIDRRQLAHDSKRTCDRGLRPGLNSLDSPSSDPRSYHARDKLDEGQEARKPGGIGIEDSTCSHWRCA